MCPFELTQIKVLEQENRLQSLESRFRSLRWLSGTVENWWSCVNEDFGTIKILNFNKTPPPGGFIINQKLIIIEQDELFPTRRFLTAVEPRNQAVRGG